MAIYYITYTENSPDDAVVAPFGVSMLGGLTGQHRIVTSPTLTMTATVLGMAAGGIHPRLLIFQDHQGYVAASTRLSDPVLSALYSLEGKLIRRFPWLGDRDVSAEAQLSGTLRLVYHVIRGFEENKVSGIAHITFGQAQADAAATSFPYPSLTTVPVVTGLVGVHGQANAQRVITGDVEARIWIDALTHGFATPGFNQFVDVAWAGSGSIGSQRTISGSVDSAVTLLGTLAPVLQGTVAFGCEVKGSLSGHVRNKAAVPVLLVADITTSELTFEGMPLQVPHWRIWGTVEATAVLQGNVRSQFVPKSPSMVLFDGNNRLESADVGNNSNLGTVRTIQVTVDPEVTNGYVSGTILEKFECYHISYDVGTGKITVRVYSDDGLNYVQATTGSEYRTRKTLHAVFDNGTLALYTNGQVDTTSLITTAPFVEARANTTPLVVGNRPNGSSGIRGAVYAIIFWTRALSSFDVSKFDGSNGRIPRLLTDDVDIAWVANDITSSGADYNFDTWVESKIGYTFYEVRNSLSGRHVLIQPENFIDPNLVYNRWDSTLVDTAIGTAPLTTEYGIALPFRTWGNLLLPPQIVTGFRRYRNDITVIINLRKVVGTISCLICELQGIRLTYNQTSGELYAIVGNDTSMTMQNRRYSFGYRLFALEGIPQLVALRYNSELDDLDVFIGDQPFPAIAKDPTNQYVDQSGIILSDEADFKDAQVIPSCISYPAILKVRELQAIKVSDDIRNIRFTGLNLVDPEYLPHQILPPITPAVVEVDGIPWSMQNKLWSGVLSSNYHLDNVPVAEAIDQRASLLRVPPYRNPLPRVLTVSATATKLMTVVGNAGPTDAGDCISWFEIEMNPSSEIRVAFGRVALARFDVNRNDIRQFQIPSGISARDKRVRFVIQSSRDGQQIWYSAWARTDDSEEFDNNPPAIINLPPTIIQNPPAEVVVEQQLTAQLKRTQALKRAAAASSIVKVSNRSRYKFTNVYDVSGKGHNFALMSVLDDLIESDGATKIHTVTEVQAGFPDKIMFDLYGDGHEDLWWIIPYMNNMIDPTVELTMGKRVIVPTPDTINRFVAKRSTVLVLQES